jgi:tRNA dimethylallyltransferase
MKTLIVLLGPTGVGKTDVSIRLAQYFSCPIISADSRQIFKEMKIGTAVPDETQLEAVKHYFIGSHSVHEKYNAGIYEQEALELIEKLFVTGDVLLMAGGSMLYIDIICKGMDDIPSVDVETRNYWQDLFEKNGLKFIQDELKRLDPVHYSKVDLSNYKRVLHALEICTIAGKPFSLLRTGLQKERPFRILKIGLTREREELYERINARVDQMMLDGLLDEAQKLLPFKNLNALNTVGYKELFGYFEGEYDLETAVNKIKKNTRVYARKQLTWFKRDDNIHWFHPDQVSEIIQLIEQSIN